MVQRLLPTPPFPPAAQPAARLESTLEMHSQAGIGYSPPRPPPTPSPRTAGAGRSARHCHICRPRQTLRPRQRRPTGAGCPPWARPHSPASSPVCRGGR
eukprot:scaffold34730_cov112-Isochrysis_galbana.AAC.4